MLNSPDGTEDHYDRALLGNDLRRLAPDLVIIDRTSVETTSKGSDRFDAIVAQIGIASPKAKILNLGADSRWATEQSDICSTSNTIAQSEANGGATPPKAATSSPLIHWKWSPDTDYICASRKQLASAEKSGGLPNLEPDLNRLRAEALIDWLSKPAGLPDRVVRR